VDNKLLKPHAGDPKYAYRHEITNLFPKLQKLGETEYLQIQRDRWTCPDCGGRVVFYYYRCKDCGKEIYLT
jgi:DNA-directed RNA polymerase subunit RPC12/RpoP